MGEVVKNGVCVCVYVWLFDLLEAAKCNQILAG